VTSPLSIRTRGTANGLEVIVIRGGQAGLAIGYFLTKQGREFVMLEAANQPAAAWLERRDSPGHCPECGMKLLPAPLVAELGAGHEPAHHDEGAKAHKHAHAGHSHATAEGIEWEDDMVEVNRMTTPANMRWKLIDRSTGAENAAIDWRFRVGDRVKIRLLNEMAGDHPMHHPFHVHGAGRFLVLSRDGVAEPNLVWKDTVLVRTGQIVDILLDVTNPGLWMAHCHIAEHHESGMMFSFNVAPARKGGQ
jgi:FtsP/CotA-like multicopper oxidase with cupredoxin domain